MKILSKRIFAYIIDLVIVNIIVIIPFKPLLESLSKNNADSIYSVLASSDKIGLTILVGLTITLLIVMYWAILEYKLQQSVGKMFFNLYVITKNNKLKFSQCFIRNITKSSTLLLILDSLNIFKSDKQQRYFEKLSNTYIIAR